MNPFAMEANRDCRREYSKEMCVTSLAILERTVLVPMHPEHDDAAVAAMIANIERAAAVASGALAPEAADIRDAEPIDAQKFDLAGHG